MKRAVILLLLILSAATLLMLSSCDNSTGPKDSHQFPAAIDSVAMDIRLIVYSYGTGAVLDTLFLKTECDLTVDVEDENPLFDPPQYYIYATCPGFYTELYHCQRGETVTFDLDAVPDVPNSITGAIFAQQPLFDNCYFGDKDITLTESGGTLSISGNTDSLGRYGFSGLNSDYYILHFLQYGAPYSFEIYNSELTNYRDIFFVEAYIVDAPNIYLYPETETALSVNIDFPAGGEIIASEPPYNSGWQVSATPDGIINGQYEYLFYEVRQAVPLTSEYGWVLDGTSLESGLRNLLSDYGFVGREIDDFIDFWLPRLEGSPWYAVYPQDAESLITLSIDPPPDNVLRAIFLIRSLNRRITIPPPAGLNGFTRDGFTAVEWGVINMAR